MTAPPRRLDRLALFVGAGFGSGYAPRMPGTFGTAAAALLVFALSHTSLPAHATLLGLAAGTALLCIPVGTRVERACDRVDPGFFVLDEFAGYFTAVLVFSERWPGIATLGAAFAWFRVFDVWKPPPLRRLQGLHGGLGIVIDDVGAGIYSLGAVWLTRVLLPDAPW